jgi:hypothetical protein
MADHLTARGELGLDYLRSMQCLREPAEPSQTIDRFHTQRYSVSLGGCAGDAELAVVEREAELAARKG